MMRKKQAGFTLMETMVALVVLLAVSAVVMSGMMQMMKTQGTITNRTEMHTSVRAATELLQQEIGQAGKIVSATGTMNAVAAGATPDAPIPAVTTFNGFLDPNGNSVLFEGAWVTVDAGLARETVQLRCPLGIGGCPTGPTVNWQATFTWPHGAPGAPPVPASLQGSFSSGIVPPAIPALPGALTNIPVGYAGYPAFPAIPVYPYPNSPTSGSTGNVLKLFGDVNGDGLMVYVEYTCLQGTLLAPGFLYRNQVPWTWAAPMPPLDPSKVVLANVLQNPNDANGNPVPCFKYQLQTGGGANAAALDYAFVTDVAVTLTVQTSNVDPQEPTLANGQPNYQRETKALLNVSPRNVYDAYLSSTYAYSNRIQPMPLNLKGILLPTE